MVEKGPINSIEELLGCPDVQKARSIEVSIHDAVHFRLLKPDYIFQMAELHLARRHPGRFEGFAKCRTEVETAVRGSSIPDKIAACCTRNPDWLDGRQILHSTELEVWMDMSYPNPLTLQLYHAVLMAGKSFVIPKLGPFSETFHTLLKEKNEYELTSDPLPPEATVQVLVGDHPYAREDSLNLAFHKRAYRVHPFASESNLGSQLANGILEKAIEDHSAKMTGNDVYLPHSIGYRLMGPSFVLLIQALFSGMGPVGFVGPGADLLEELSQSLRAFWPALPEIAHGGAAMVNYSFFPEAGSSTSLFPDSSLPAAASILNRKDLDPVKLTLPGVHLFVKGMLEGPKAAEIRRGAKAFVRDYASLTRGLEIQAPVEPVARHWRETLLAPEKEVLDWALLSGALPEFVEAQQPWQVGKRLREGPWPSANYFTCKPLSRWWLKKKQPELAKLIESAQKSC